MGLFICTNNLHLVESLFLQNDKHRMANGGVPRESGSETGGGNPRLRSTEPENRGGDGEPGSHSCMQN